jgi:hypothetical protein
VTARWNRRFRRAAPIAVALAATIPVAAAEGAGGVDLTVLSVDPYTNGDSYHRTEVEADTYSYGSTIVGTYQVGRTSDGGASNNGWATSTDSGVTWTDGFLPGITEHADPPGPYDRASDPAVAYDAAHDVWLINSLAVQCCARGVAVLVSRSTNGGITWGPPIVVDEASPSQFFDKNWIACDNWPQSPFYGRCYVQWDDAFGGNQLHMSTSANGGLTWLAADVPNDSVQGGQPVVQPNGRVVVPLDGLSGRVEAHVSNDGGMSYSGPFTISTASTHFPAGNLRFFLLPSAEVDAGGRVYVVWPDCRFRSGCAANDIVMSTSTNGQAWTPVVRIPIDPVTSQADHFLPGIGVDRTTSGSSARLGLTFYGYPDRSCSASTCRLTVGFMASPDGGSTWTPPELVAGPFRNTWLPLTTAGYMVGDYTSTSWSDQGRAYPIFAAARAGSCSISQYGSCRVTMVTPTGGLAPTGASLPVGREPPVASAPPRQTEGLITSN